MRSLLCGSVIVLVVGNVCALAAPSFSTPASLPTSAVVGVTAQLMVTSQLTTVPSDPKLLANGVNLLRVDASGVTLSILGVMHDDGQNGDAMAGDGIFTLRYSTTETSPGQIRLQVSAAFQGLLQRIKSPVGTVSVAALAVSANSSPTPNAAGWNNGTVTVSFTCIGGVGGIAVCPQSVQVTQEGLNQVISGTAKDGAGNTASASVTVNVDKTEPTVTSSLSPAPNAAGWNNTPVTLTFTCSDALSGVVQCPAPVNVATEGTQTVSGTGVDLAGNSFTDSATVKIDKTAPSITVVSPMNGSTVTAPAQTITGTVSEAGSGMAGLSCNFVLATISGSSFTCNLTLAQGTNPITVQGSDLAGNLGSTSLTLIYAAAPQVTITSPTNLSYVNISPTTVNGTVSDSSASVLVNSIPAPVSNGGFSVQVPLAEGPNILTATATNGAGSTSTASLQVTLDTTPPHVTITSPADQFATTDSTITVSGSINDIVVGTVNPQQAQVTVNGITAQVANRMFLAQNVPLNVGPNVVQAVGRDQVGNAATAQITVIRQAPTAQPKITMISGNGQAGTIGSLLPQALVVAVTDSTGSPVANQYVIFKVTENNGMVAVGNGIPASSVLATTNALGQAQAQWTLGMRSGAGGNLVEAYAVGFNGTAIFTATGNQGPAGKIVIDTGNNQIGVVNQPLPKPLIAVVVDSGNNRLANVPVTFTMIQGGGSIAPSYGTNFTLNQSNAGTTSITVNTDSDGRVAATLILGYQEGNSNNLVEASFTGNTSFPASFTASGRAEGPTANTTISGVVLDNSQVPIPGVTVWAVLSNLLTSNSSIINSIASVKTDAQGQFTITQAPVGFVKILVNGSTAQRTGTYPTMDYDLVTIAGQNNTLQMPIYLLPLSQANQVCVTATTGGGTLTMPEAPGFSLTFAPGQVTFPGGSQTGCVSVTVVHPDRVPMAPGFGQQPRFIVTIQPSGAIFNPPAPITLPNVDGLAPRAVTEMYSFDHDIGSFVAIGTGTVSDDGQVIASNKGVGVLKAGWHCGGDPQANGTAADCPSCRWCINNSCQSLPLCTDNSSSQDARCPFGQVCDGAGNCTTGESLIPRLCGNGAIGIVYDNPTTLSCLGTCGAKVQFDVTSITPPSSCPNVDLVGARTMETVTSDDGCIKYQYPDPATRPPITTGGGCPVSTGNQILGCTDTYNVCIGQLVVPPTGCTETYTQTITLDRCVVAIKKIVFTIPPGGCAGTVTVQ